MRIEVESTSELTPHEKALIAAGEELMKSSVATSRDFCKSMIGISISAIPVQITLMKLFIEESKTIADVFGAYWLGPIILTLVATCLFTAGYLPSKKLISLEDLDELELFLSSASNRRFYYGVSAFFILLLGISWTTYLLSSA